MGDSKDLSIIIPVYNEKEQLLINCLQSIEHEMKKNLSINYEIIIIDDGSKEYIEQLINDYKVNHPIMDINYIKQQNMGVSAARNQGIKLATGKYITFIDSDDLISAPITIPSNINEDIIYFDMKLKTQNKEEYHSFSSDINNEQFMIPKDALRYLLGAKVDVFNGPVAKLFKREFLLENNIYFDNNLISGEDLIFNLKCLEIVNRVYYIPCSFYIYNYIYSSSNTRLSQYPEKLYQNINYNFNKINEYLIMFDIQDSQLNRIIINRYIQKIYLVSLKLNKDVSPQVSIRQLSIKNKIKYLLIKLNILI